MISVWSLALISNRDIFYVGTIVQLRLDLNNSVHFLCRYRVVFSYQQSRKMSAVFFISSDNKDSQHHTLVPSEQSLWNGYKVVAKEAYLFI